MAGVTDQLTADDPAVGPELDDALARSDAYRLLSAALTDPDAPEAAEPEFEALVEALADLGIEAGAAELAALRPLVDRETRATGHRRLFGHTVAHGCPAYETEYGQRHVFGQAQDLADIGGYYAAFGLQPAARGERLDHITCELGFLSILALKEAAALAASDQQRLVICHEAAASFLRDHAGRWLPAVAGRASRMEPASGHAVLLTLAARLVAEHAARAGVVPVRLGADDLRPIEEEPDDLSFECGDSDAGPGLEVPG